MSIGGMKIKLFELQDDNKEAKKLRLERLLEGWKNIKQIFYYQSLPYMPKIIYSELINRYHNALFAAHFGIKKT